MKLERTKDYEKNERQCKGDAQPCARCGRPIKEPKNARWIELSIWGDILDKDDPESGGPDSQGCFPIGTICCHKIGLNGPGEGI